MDELRKRLKTFSSNTEESERPHPFGLPHIIDVESLISRSPSRGLPIERRRSKSNDSRRFVAQSIAASTDLSVSLSSSWSTPNSMSSSSSIRFPDIYSRPTTSDLSGFGESMVRFSSQIPSMVTAFDFIILKCVTNYVELSYILDADVYRQANKVMEVFRAQRQFLLASTGISDPENSMTGTGPEQAAKIKEIKEMKGGLKESSYSAHLAFISDTIGILGWVVAGPNPNQFIRDVYNSGKNHVEDISSKSEAQSRRRQNSKWVSAWKWTVSELDTYVGKYHPQGLKWHKG